MSPACLHADAPFQRGAALITALVLMLALMVIGVSAARTALHAEKSSRGERDRSIAFQAAEAALADAEHDIEGGNDAASPRALLFAPGSVQGFDAGCGAAPNVNVGLCRRTSEPAPPAWQSTELARPGQEAFRSVAYGQFTGARMPVGHGPLPARLPRYIIELVPLAHAGNDPAPNGSFYRVTAIGFGSSEHTHVVLQTYYLKASHDTPGGDAGEPPPPTGLVVRTKRLAWREVSNWQELHEAAQP